MNIGSISSTTTMMSTATVSRPGGDGDGDGDDGKRAGKAGGSQVAQMFKQLEQLEKSDPAKFKQVAADMAKTLRADAQKQTGDASSALTKIADGLDKASQTGSLSAMQPQGQGAQGAHKHGHHHHGGGSGGTGGASGSANGTPDVQSELLQAFTTALDAANQPAAPAPAPAPTPPTSI